MIEIYTDGSSTGGVGAGGWAFLVVEEEVITYEEAGSADNTTNNRMELSGVIEGLRYARAHYDPDVLLRVFSDSQYVVKGIMEWYPSWEAKMARGKTIKNQDLWIDLKSLVDLFNNVELVWIRGHAGHEYNERCDVLAKTAKKVVEEGRLNEFKQESPS